MANLLRSDSWRWRRWCSSLAAQGRGRQATCALEAKVAELEENKAKISTNDWACSSTRMDLLEGEA